MFMRHVPRISYIVSCLHATALCMSFKVNEVCIFVNLRSSVLAVMPVNYVGGKFELGIAGTMQLIIHLHIGLQFFI